MLTSILKASKLVGRFVIQNSPTILTIAGCCGVGATAVYSGKAAIKASKKLEELEYESDRKPTMVEKAKCVAPDVAPAVIMGATTIACILFAHRIHIQRNAAIMAAYTMVNEKYKDYKDEVIKELGPKKEDRMHDKAAQTMVNRELTEEKVANAYRTRFGDVLFVDNFGIVFYSSYEAVERARLKITDIAQKDCYDMRATLNDFYEALEIPTTDFGKRLVWKLPEIQDETFQTTIPIFTERVCKAPGTEGIPAVCIDYDEYLTMI